MLTLAQQDNMFGMAIADIDQNYINSLTAKISGLEMVVMSILSDAQELTEMGDKESVRQQLNIAKYILSEMMETK